MHLKLSTKNLSTIISKSVINNLAVTFFLYVFMAKFFFNGNINVLFLQLLSQILAFLAYVLSEIWQN